MVDTSYALKPLKRQTKATYAYGYRPKSATTGLSCGL